MMGFALAIFALMVLAVLLLLWPLSRQSVKTVSGDIPRTQANVELYQQRLADIAEEQAQGLLDNDSAEALRKELQKQLLDDAPVSQPSTVSQRSRSQLIFITALLVPVVALTVYWRMGEPEAWTIPALIKQSEQAYEANVDNTAQLEQLSAQLAAFPEREQFSSLRAKILMQLQQYSEATNVFAELQKRFPDDASILAQSVQARYLANARKFDQAMAADAKRALQLDPNQPTLLGLLGMQAFEETRYTDAVNYWQRLVEILPPQSAQADVIQGPLKRARELAGMPEQEKSVDSSAGITVTVALAGNSKIPANAILFVFAKSAAEGAPPMPLAVQRIPAPQLPLTVKLDDTLAMTPALKLSTADEVIITARLSTSGDVRGNPGDLQVSTSPLKWRELKKSVELTLSPAN